MVLVDGSRLTSLRLVMITTAHSKSLPTFSKNRLNQALVIIYAAVWIWAAIHPLQFSDWLLENILVVAAVAFIIWLARVQLLSDVSNVMATIFLILHTVGAHYTYSLVPLGDWLKDWAGFQRNHYDRIVHFSFGLLIIYPLREMLLRSGIAPKRWAGFFAFTIIGTCSVFYELMEWGAAVTVDPSAGDAFLGTQGDPFDSQEDQAMALLGGVVTLATTRVIDAFSPRHRAA